MVGLLERFSCGVYYLTPLKKISVEQLPRPVSRKTAPEFHRI
jgi:hypothetical protein